MSHPQSLQEWLAHCEHLHAAMIDLTLERVQAVRGRMALAFDGPLFAVAGTNGKGSTCAMLEAILRQAGYRVGVYTSPHLVHFEERCRVNGEAAAAEALIADFEAVEAARDGVALTYFEFTTLVIARHLSRAELDVVVLEVGLGGRLDAVNAFDADCAIITSIDLDHMAFLGGDRESIGREKAGIMRTGGLYFRASDLEGLRKIYATIDQMEKTEVKVKVYDQFDDLYPWLLLPALGLLGMWIVLRNTRFLSIP